MVLRLEYLQPYQGKLVFAPYTPILVGLANIKAYWSHLGFVVLLSIKKLIFLKIDYFKINIIITAGLCLTDKGKPGENQGRKATGLNFRVMIAGLPKKGNVPAFFVLLGRLN